MATDLTVFALVGSTLEVLLIKRGQAPFKGCWALPGGFLERGETLEECARRELQEETGLELRHLRQLGTFAEPRRDPRGRVISVAFLALVRTTSPELGPGGDAHDARWFVLKALPSRLAFDHTEILALARRRLAALLYADAAVLRLLPNAFTLGEAQALYELLSLAPLDKRNFRSWLQNAPFIEATAKQRRGPHRPARLYRLRARAGGE
jgi:8-oxo-dGTP diphosphatase